MNLAAENPLKNLHEEAADPDVDWVRGAVAGDAEALSLLVERHQRWIYHLALRLVLSPVDAEDLAQEAVVRIITRLDRFEGRSQFRTWAYRIVVNCFLDGKRRTMEREITTFSAYGEELDALGLEALRLPRELEPDRRVMVEEAKVGCMLGMLLCLDRQQRVTYVLGEIFETPGPVAAEILGISAVAFRKRLQRARRDLVAFMNEKCGLLKTSNPCRCEKKTMAFMQQGWVDAKSLKFTTRHVERLQAEAAARSRKLCEITEEGYAHLFRDHPLLPGPDLVGRLQDLLRDPAVRETFDLN